MRPKSNKNKKAPNIKAKGVRPKNNRVRPVHKYTEHKTCDINQLATNVELP